MQSAKHRLSLFCYRSHAFESVTAQIERYWLPGVVAGDGAAAGAGVVLKVRFRIFQS
jgi:hypothetical protein